MGIYMNKKGHTTITNAQKSHLVKTFFEILHSIKLYHWKTKSYSHHKETDHLHEKLSAETDRFIEVLIGKTSARIQMVEEKIKLYFSSNVELNNFEVRADSEFEVFKEAVCSF